MKNCSKMMGIASLILRPLVSVEMDILHYDTKTQFAEHIEMSVLSWKTDIHQLIMCQRAWYPETSAPQNIFNIDDPS